ncbi:replication initiator protein A [Vibrio parahaemolyticus]|nr:replication initiator protein A [Vibrio parahaemolyticus]HCG8016792.1 replication initiator protein A [Vibrio parahaemolyticus]
MENKTLFESKLEKIGQTVKKRNEERQASESKPARRPVDPLPKSSMRTPPVGDAQQDFFVPALYDIAAKDTHSVMDVAVFRLSKRDKRAGETLRYELNDGYVEVTAGPQGMASVWDYDIVLMAISHLTEHMNRFRDGRCETLPGRVFRPHVSEILKFCRRSDGGRQYVEVEAALDRLKTTTLKMVRTIKRKKGRPMREAKSEGLISNYKTISYADTGRLAMVELEIPDWIYREVVESDNPEVLTVHPEFFLIEPGVGRFLYRLARRAAGKNYARWSFRTIYERSGSAGAFKEFCRMLRALIKANDLPEYLLTEEKGKEGPILLMAHRDHVWPQNDDENELPGV